MKFKFKFRKCKGKKFISFDLNQISEYTVGAQLDFIHCFMNQIEHVNGSILMGRDLQQEISDMVNEYNIYNLSPKKLETMYLKRSLVDFFSYSINSPLIDDWKEALKLFDMVYQ